MHDIGKDGTSGISLDPFGWSWLSAIRDQQFSSGATQDIPDVRLAIEDIERTLAQVGYTLQAAYNMVDDSGYGVDQTKATITAALALLCMTETSFASVIQECNSARLLRAKLEVVLSQAPAADRDEGEPEAQLEVAGDVDTV